LKLSELTGWSLNDESLTVPLSMTTYKDCIRRFCEIFGNSTIGEPQATNSVSVCPHCSTFLCTCSHSGGIDLNEELIIFDFGSKTTWFKYTGDAGIGQLSMHPTIQVSDVFVTVCDLIISWLVNDSFGSGLMFCWHLLFLVFLATRYPSSVSRLP